MKRHFRSVSAFLCGLILLTGRVSAGPLEELQTLASSSPEDYGRVFDKNLASAIDLAAGPVTQRQLKGLMLEDLDSVRNMISARYAPAGWKQEQFGWNLDAEIQKVKDRVNSADSFSVKNYQKALKTLLNSTRDYHVSASFYSTETAFLPFSVTEAGGRYFLSGINRKALPENVFPFKVGDELTDFGGKPVDKTVARLKKRAGMNNVPRTDLAMAAMALTSRRGSSADSVPRGPVSISIKQAGAAEAVPFQLKWAYAPELIKPQPFVTKSLVRKLPLSWLEMMMLETPSTPGGAQASYALGNKNGFLPDFGEKLWQAPAENSFRAYVYRSPAGGKNIGYVRIPTYYGEDPGAMVNDFAALIQEFNQRADALIIDQTNNPGGIVFYLYALASMLTDAPLNLPKHYITLTQADIAEAVNFMRGAAAAKTDNDAKAILGPALSGYPVTYDLLKKISGFYAGVIKQWGAGKTITDPLPVFGLDSITPNAAGRYSKPLMILTNQLDFSGGDFFPAIMQDNKRAVTFGERTAGAGGVVKPYNRDNNLLGVETINLTATIAERADGRPIENLGVTPDIPYTVTPADVQGGYADYIKAADAAVSGLLK